MEDYQIACCRPITDFGAGVLLPPGQGTPDRIAQACQEILADPSYERCAQALAKEIAAQPTPAEVAHVLEQRAAR
jgi:UDP:flavonoid glycosyltransferase YjiC (YdhE family)